MTEIFISYARSTAREAHVIAESLRALGYGVWRDDEIPPHRPYAEVILERLMAAKAVVVVWSAEAVKSEWVQSEADRARTDRKLVQLRIDDAPLPMPFDRIQCADMTGWSGDTQNMGWRRVLASIQVLRGESVASVSADNDKSNVRGIKPSIIIKPFDNMTGAQGSDVLIHGIMEEITTALSRCTSFDVIAYTGKSALEMRGAEARPAINLQHRRYVLEGSVRRSVDRVRISSKLTDEVEGVQVWASQYDNRSADSFEMQEAVALNIVGKIEAAIIMAETRRVLARPIENPTAYEFLLRAMVVGTGGRASTLDALRLCDMGLQRDPAFTPLLATASIFRAWIDVYGWSDEPDANRRIGIDLARKALLTSPTDPFVLWSAAHAVAYLERDLAGAIDLVDKAVALNPASAWAWAMSGQLRVEQGLTDDAIERLETAIRLDPDNVFRARFAGWMSVARFQQRRFDDAAALIKDFVFHSESPRGFAVLAATCGHLGRWREARAALAGYRERTSLPIEDFASRLMHDPRYRTLFLEGIALAEGAGPSTDEKGA